MYKLNINGKIIHVAIFEGSTMADLPTPNTTNK